MALRASRSSLHWRGGGSSGGAGAVALGTLRLTVCLSCLCILSPFPPSSLSCYRALQLTYMPHMFLSEIRPFAAWRGDGPNRASILPTSPTAPSASLPQQTTERSEAAITPAPSGSPSSTSQTGSTPAAAPAFRPNAMVTSQPVPGALGSSGKSPLSPRAATPSARAEPAIVQEVDSGVRTVGPGVTILPPPYTQH